MRSKPIYAVVVLHKVKCCGVAAESGQRYAKARDYAEVAKAAIKEMHRQVGLCFGHMLDRKHLTDYRSVAACCAL
jgi:uncharacterized Fe-S radical SAM superfamily protein PflX